MAEVGLSIAASRPNVINEKYVNFIRFCTIADLSTKYKMWITTSNYCAFIFYCALHVVGAFDARIQTGRLLSSLGVYSVSSQSLMYSSAVKVGNIFDKYRLLNQRSLTEHATVHHYLLLKYNLFKILHLTLIIATMIIAVGMLVGDVSTGLFVPLHVIRHSGNFRWILEISNWYGNALIGFSTIAMCSLQINCCLCICAEFVLLQLFITRNLHVESDPNNPQQQKEIHKLLREFVKCHLETKRFSKDYLKKGELFAIPLLLSGTLICSFIAYTLLTIPLTKNITGLLFIGVVIMLMYMVIFCMMIQTIHDESAVLFELMYACPWYNWDIRNRKMLLIILPSVVNPTTVSIFNLFDGGNTAMLKFFRLCYAMITFIKNIK